ncbi:MAG: hypothetical protein NZ918_03785 [Aigarchaeota archaeon]|nr:hypothetical protein [Aigarchaeota archaeon]MDW8022054.1 hypothetical protein [Nitrososphaerota archaeon]
MGLGKNFVSVLVLFTVIWATFLVVSYLIAITIFYTLEYPQMMSSMSILRVIVGLVIAGGWVTAWYKLTRFWLYRILMGKKET